MQVVRSRRILITIVCALALGSVLVVLAGATRTAQAATKNVDLNGDGTAESVVNSTVVNATPPIKVQNKVNNKAVGQAFSFAWPSAGPGGFSSQVAAGTSTGVGAIWTWQTVQQVYAFTGSTCTNDICLTRTTPSDSYKRGAFGVPGYTLTSGSLTTTTASLTSSLIQFFSPPSEKFRFTSSVDQIAPGVYRYSTTIDNSTPSIVTLDVSPGPYGCGAVCGNGVREANEACDGSDLAGRACEGLGFPLGGSLACATDCTFNTSDCVQSCDNGVREGSEVCDGSDLNGQSCVSLGGFDGLLGCQGDCAGFDVGACSALCGNGVQDGADQCDGSSFGGNACVTAGATPVFRYGFFDGSNVCAVSSFGGPGSCGLTSVGSANTVIDDNGRHVLRLTDELQGQVGAAWTISSQPVLGGFTTTFRFRAGIHSKGCVADGLALVIQDSPDGNLALGGGGGSIGYAGIPNSVAIEFDTFLNGDSGDPDANHIAIHSCGVSPNTMSHLDSCLLAQASPATYLADDQPHTATITYIPPSCLECDGTLSVYLDGAFVLSAPFTMESILPASGTGAYIGLTGATGACVQKGDILSWSLGSPLPDPGPVDGNPSCNGDCTLDLSTCYNICGNGVRELDEQCDGQDVGSAECGEAGFGIPTCTPSCTLDYSQCSWNYCGNGVVDTPTEECDDSDLGGRTSCGDFGSDPGLQEGCTPDCHYDLTPCPGICGNSTVEPALGEVCDRGNFNGHTCEDTAVPLGTRYGVLSCSPGCGTFDTSGCLPVPPPVCQTPPTSVPTVPPHSSVNLCEIKLHPPKEVTSKISVCGSNVLDPAGSCTDFLTEGTAELLVPDENATLGPVFFAPISIQITDTSNVPVTIVQPGDTVLVYIPMVNAGSSPATGVSVLLSSPAADVNGDGTIDQISVIDPVSAYPDGSCFAGFPTGIQDCSSAPPAVTPCTNLTPFKISIPANFPGDVILGFNLSVTYSTPPALGSTLPNPAIQVPLVLGVTSLNCVGGFAPGDPCNEGNPCTVNETCNAAGQCGGGDPVGCDDGNPCTDDSCDPTIGCVHAPLTGPSCGGGNLCASGGTCQSGICVESPVSCDDGNPCTADSCNPATGCSHTPVVCNDDNPCTDDVCEPSHCSGPSCVTSVGGCVYLPAPGRACEDGNSCTTGDACSSIGACAGGPAQDCNDGNACTTDSCDPATGCVHAPTVCDDGEACTIDSCDPATGCVHTTIDCNDSNACTTDSCNAQTGACVNAPIDCNDGNACTTDSCDQATGCIHRPVTCDDLNLCTGDRCDPATGCVFAPVPGLPCDDNNACTSFDTCNSDGQCSGGPPPNCDDANPCTDDQCVATAPGGCVHTPAPGRGCNDGNACTTNDACSAAGQCIGGTPANCNDNNACTIDSCNPTSGCAFAPTSGNSCSDGSACTTGDTCQSGTCVGGATLSCSDGNICTNDSCNPATGCVNAPAGNCGADPKGYGYWKRLCRGPLPSGEMLTMIDVNCVNNSCTFASVASVADLCERLHPSPPSDKCEQAESKLMTLELNACRGRVIAGAPADSPCGGSTTVGQLMAQTDAALCSPGRTRDTCVRADCMADDVNTGLALWTNSLRIQRAASGAILIIWGAPYATPSTEAPARYRVWRRPTSASTFALVAEVSGNNLSYLDKQAHTDNYQYEVTALW